MSPPRPGRRHAAAVGPGSPAPGPRGPVRCPWAGRRRRRPRVRGRSRPRSIGAPGWPTIPAGVALIRPSAPGETDASTGPGGGPGLAADIVCRDRPASLARGRVESATVRHRVPDRGRVRATAPAPPAPSSTTGPGHRGQSRAKPRAKPYRSVLWPTVRPSWKTTCSPPSSAASGRESSRYLSTSCLPGWVMFRPRSPAAARAAAGRPRPGGQAENVEVDDRYR